MDVFINVIEKDPQVCVKISNMLEIMKTMLGFLLLSVKGN